MRSGSIWAWRIAAGVIALALCVVWARQITGSRISKDGGDTLAMAVNLRHIGVISLAEEPPYSPSMYREPVPILTTAVAISINDALSGQAAFNDYFSGELARRIKLQNIAWMGLLSIATFLSVRLLTSSAWLGLAGVLLLQIHIPFSRSGLDGLGVDSLDSDLPAAALLTLASYWLAKGFRDRRLRDIAFAGITFGLLALTKAAFLYVMAGVVLVILGMSALRTSRLTLKAGLAGLAVLLVTFTATVIPWMYRNYVQLGYLQISQRGGIVLSVRAVKDGMNAEEYRGAFYVWGPNSLQPLLGKVLGFNARDLQRGGRLQRLNRATDSDFYADDLAAERAGRPEDAISYYRKGRAELSKIRIQLEREGRLTSAMAADEAVKKLAEQRILAHPFKHLATTVPFVWRGAILLFPVLLAALIYAMRRRLDLGLFVLPAVGLLAFYALLSHFIPRYSVPALPAAIVAFLALAHAIWSARTSERLAPSLTP